MNVDAPASRSPQDLVRQNPSVSDNHCLLGIMRRKQLLRLFNLKPRGLKHLEAVRKREFFDWRETYLVTTPGRFVRLWPDSHDFVTVCNTLPQGWHGSLRRAHEDYPCHPR